MLKGKKMKKVDPITEKSFLKFIIWITLLPVFLIPFMDDVILTTLAAFVCVNLFLICISYQVDSKNKILLIMWGGGYGHQLRFIKTSPILQNYRFEKVKHFYNNLKWFELKCALFWPITPFVIFLIGNNCCTFIKLVGIIVFIFGPFINWYMLNNASTNYQHPKEIIDAISSSIYKRKISVKDKLYKKIAYPLDEVGKLYLYVGIFSLVLLSLFLFHEKEEAIKTIESILKKI